MRFAAFVVVLFAFVVAAVGVGEAQSRAERDALSNLGRAVRAAQSDSSPRRLADVRRASERVQSAFQAADQIRKSADLSLHAAQDGEEDLTRGGRRAGRRYAELVGVRSDDSNVGSLWRSHNRAGAAHMRHCIATVAAVVDAADALEGLVPRFIGYDVRNSSALLSLASAKLEAIRVQGSVLREIDALEEDGRSERNVWYGEVDRPLSGLVSAVVGVARGLESYREASEVAAEVEASRTPPAFEAPLVAGVRGRTPEEQAIFEERVGIEAPVVEEVSLEDLWRRGVEEALQRADARVEALAGVTCGFSRVTDARIAVSNAWDRINGEVDGGGRFVGDAAERRGFQVRLDAIRERLEDLDDQIEPVCR